MEGEEVFCEVIGCEDVSCGAVESAGRLVGGGGFGFMGGAVIEADEVDEVVGLGEEGATGVEVFRDFEEVFFGLFFGELMEEGLTDTEAKGGQVILRDERMGGLLDTVVTEDELEVGFVFRVLGFSSFE
jgi:hypothetical protein